MVESHKVLVMHEAPHRHNPHEFEQLLSEQIAPSELVIADSYDEVMEESSDADVIITREITSEILDNARSLDWIQALSAGVNKYDLDVLQERGIILTNAAGVHANPIAEQVLGYMLMFERNLLEGVYRKQNNEWRHFTGGELKGQTLGVIGVGEIGGRIAELGSAVDMNVIGTKRNTDDAPDIVDSIYPPEKTDIVASQSDYLVVACPLTDETRHLIGIEEFSSMKTDAVVINIARGEVIDEDDLEWALQRGKIHGAALDVQRKEPLPASSPLWDLSNVIITPHMGGATPKYLERCAEIFLENYERYLEGEYDEFTNRIV